MTESLFDKLEKGKHPEHRMHKHSLDAYADGQVILTGRREMIYEHIKRAGSGTDREICQRMGFRDMNSVRPRITELVNVGILVEVGTVRDEVTGKTVRIVGIQK